jgi:hypothetical protein
VKILSTFLFLKKKIEKKLFLRNYVRFQSAENVGIKENICWTNKLTYNLKESRSAWLTIKDDRIRSICGIW